MPANQNFVAYTTNQQLLASRFASGEERDNLVETYLPHVKFIADRISAKLPPSVEADDLYSAGVIGLIDAVEKFDSSRGVLFKTYAELRIRGAILDSLRELDWVPRSVRRRAREVEAAYLQIEQEKGRPAEESEVASRLGLNLRDFQSLLTELQGLTITGLDNNDDDNESPQKQILDLNDTPLSHYEKTETRNNLAAAIDQLPERERQVIALYYVEELTMKEIGQVLGVTESRVSQMRTQAIVRLRSKLNYLKSMHSV